MNETIDRTVVLSNATDAQTKNMIEFIYKYEPIYIQRQISQCLAYIFPDTAIQWRLSYFNDIKMPLLTTKLMYKSDLSLADQMKRFRKVITLNSLTVDETFLKNATKNNTMHRKAIEIVQEAMASIMETEHDNSLREVNMDTFLQRCNYELMCNDPEFCAAMGIKVGDQDTGSDI